ncbi:Rpn family recombination-promoting nuclease/putative transposase [Nocardia sp. alder85J]|uniref:Rpn family recombination-promoting nuclease/putative transposase n=1 Tax=Nocardia sp. alder85J TaxID=2862949 RepID=UPI001CD1F7B7|nr:Rpn family recombination-promoting nuclease/putative transposase [Nocardia sp. alder85J]MCX4091229.1 Rpn family recombination-promoting nuclease/putative transposase [Nocardia sp. alder85J]
MGEKPNNPHDAYFRAELSNPEVAAGELRSVLSAAVSELMDWSVMERQSGSFVPAELRSRYSDILFRTRWNNRDAFVYLLIEHQSSQDPLMPFRMVEYMVAIWARYLEDRKKQRPPVTRLPLILPVVVHVSADGARWSVPVELGDILDVDEEVRDLLGDYLPRFRFLLDDVNAIGVRELLARQPAVGVILVMLLQAPKHDHIEEVLFSLIEHLRLLTPEQIYRLLMYLFTVSKTSASALRPVFDQLGPQAKEAMMTVADEFRAEGRVEGQAEGRVQGQADLLIHQFSLKFGSLSDRVIRTVRAADAVTLRELSERFVTASSIDEVIA